MTGMEITEVLGNLGDFIGGPLLIATLVYLAIQVRHTARFAETQYHRDVVTLNAPILDWIARDADLASIYRRGIQDWDALDVDERMRLNSLLLQWVQAFKAVSEASDRGILDRTTYDAWEGSIAGVLGLPGGSRWWSAARSVWPQDLVARIDSSLQRFPPSFEYLERLGVAEPRSP